MKEEMPTSGYLKTDLLPDNVINTNREYYRVCKTIFNH